MNEIVANELKGVSLSSEHADASSVPSKSALARSSKKRSFFLASQQDHARSCKILWNLVGFCRNLVQYSCKILARMQEKGPFLWRFCKSIFTGVTSTIVKWHPLLGFGSTKLPWLWLSGSRGGQIHDLNLVQDFTELWTLELGSKCLNGVNYLCLVTCLMQDLGV